MHVAGNWNVDEFPGNGKAGQVISVLSGWVVQLMSGELVLVRRNAADSKHSAVITPIKLRIARRLLPKRSMRKMPAMVPTAFIAATPADSNNAVSCDAYPASSMIEGL